MSGVDDPNRASEQVQLAMTFFLNTVFPAIEPKLLRPQNWEMMLTTHISFFADQYEIEAATALLLMKHFCNTFNIYYNLGWKNEGGEMIPEEHRTKPSARKRRKTVGKDVTPLQIMDDLTNFIEKMERLRKEAGFVERMQRWDEHCCAKRGVEVIDRIPRVSTIPVSQRQQQQDPATDQTTTRLMERCGGLFASV